MAAGLVEDQPVVVTDDGQRIGVGDTVVTRQNSRDLDVANRDVWAVTAVEADGGLVLAASPSSGLSGERRLPAEYVHGRVELGYAATVHGVQARPRTVGTLVLDANTSAAAAYVGMTRGRLANTVHVVAADLEEARAKWIQTAGRERADLGPAAAREAAERAADRYPGHHGPHATAGRAARGDPRTATGRVERARRRAGPGRSARAAGGDRPRGRRTRR